ncbi:helix-turn-helix domain-containing protein [Domibacillus indicus]|nr:helix-turn-helix domain-containing protein [Domibacillus indicus]
MLAEKVNVSRQTVAKWESEEALPDIHKRENVS